MKRTTPESFFKREIKICFDYEELKTTPEISITEVISVDNSYFVENVSYSILIRQKVASENQKLTLNRSYIELSTFYGYLSQFYNEHFLPHFPVYSTLAVISLNENSQREKKFEMELFLRKLFSKKELFFHNDYFRLFFLKQVN